MQVYITQTGSRYHARTDLPCLENARGHTVVDLGVAVDGGLRPCLVCDAPPMPDSSEGDRRWLRAIDEWHKSGMFESIWEEAFARRILARIDEVSVDDLEPQAYINSGSDAFKVDFLIASSHLVLEVDGFAKAGQSPTSVDLEKRNRRDAALQTLGYTVLHFTNAQVQEEPQACATAIRSAVAGSHKTPPPPTSAAPHTPVPVPAESRPATTIRAAGSPTPSSVSTAPRTSQRGLLIGLSVAGVVIAGVLALVVLSSASNSTGSDATAPTDSSGTSFDVAATQPSADKSWVLPLTDLDCPAGFDFKANDSGLVHPPDNEPFYSKTTPERCYATLSDAVGDGYKLPPQYEGEVAP